MTDLWGRVSSATMVVAAVAIAAAALHREFFTERSSAPAVEESRYVRRWRDLLGVGRVIGDSAARVKLIEFADLQCPFCRRYNETVRRVRAKYPRDLAYVFVHMPLTSHSFAYEASRAAECAARFGKFGEMVDALFAKQDSMGKRTWTAYARDAGIADTRHFEICGADTATSFFIAAGENAGQRFGIRGTPTVFLNGWRFGRPPSDTELARAIGDILAKRRPYRGFQLNDN